MTPFIIMYYPTNLVDYSFGPNVVWQECMTPFNVVWQTPEPTEGRDNSLSVQWGIGQNEVKITDIIPSSFHSSVRLVVRLVVRWC
jgi:hypothetical protein